MKTGTFHQRLAAARAEREKVLAERGDTQEPQFLPGPKPWERPEYLRGEVGKSRREAAAKPALASVAPAKVTPARVHAKAARPAATPETIVALVPVTEEPATAPATIAPAVAAATMGAWRLRLYQVAGGVAFGVTLGIGMGYWFASAPRPGTSAPVSISAEGPTVAAPGVSTQDLAGIALPAPEVLPPSPDTPQLSNVTYVSATLPAITGGGPVGPQMAAAPAVAMAGLALPEAAAPTLAPATAPAPERAAGPGLSAAAPELDFDSPVVPLPVVFAMTAPALPRMVSDTPPPLPVLPGTLATPASYSAPEVADPLAGPGDLPLGSQGVPLPVARPAPTEVFTLIVHAPATLTEAEIATAADAFEAAGFGAITPKTVAVNIRETNVRFYSPEDQAIAARLAGVLGARLRDFTDFSPKPPEGTVEVWLAGRGGATAAKVSAKPAKTKKNRAAAAGPSQVQMLKDRLVRQLRAGALN
ncbi:MAG TPA: hypothetical protein PLI43_07445 [Albidovulum sp.]|uniref:hypothetical protein n=1 Tax=Albidovulum sp. TaxID=1872424 RepID=UPI002D05B7FB|nr:hypothetical protein [Albidovulum sp.]